MSERAEALKTAPLNACYEWDFGTGDDLADTAVFARAICEHLGIDWSMIDRFRYYAEVNGVDTREQYDAVRRSHTVAAGRALATLLEAAGVER